MTIVNRRSFVRRRITNHQRATKRTSIHGVVFKRLFDLLFAAIVLSVFSPVYLAIALAIKCTAPGPVFYVHRRVGRYRQEFDCIKFRTMAVDADAKLAQMIADSADIDREFTDNFKLKQDPRITSIGRWLRRTGLDELPQFINVLKGEMSVVGPRPLVADELVKYGRYIDRVLSVRPGLTGLWQVSGRNDLPYARRVKIDVSYVKCRNLWLDLWIMSKTVGVMIFTKQNGAY
jgi:lipopolysaccharide/colanic/teichoic acid biosynthesis glycosyltransferase